MYYQSVINTLDQYLTRSRLVGVNCHMGQSKIKVKSIPLFPMQISTDFMELQ